MIQLKTAPKKKGIGLKSMVTGKTVYIRGPIGKELKEAREFLGMTQQQVADEAEIHVSTVARAENDRNAKGSWGTLRCRTWHANAVNYQIVMESEPK